MTRPADKVMADVLALPPAEMLEVSAALVKSGDEAKVRLGWELARVAVSRHGANELVARERAHRQAAGGAP